MARAVDVNQAYRTLRDDLKLAELLIARAAGTSVRAEAPAPPDLLMEVMELREALQEAKAERNKQAVAALEADMAGRVSAATEELRSSLSALAQASTPDQLTKAQGALSRLRYYRRFQDEVARFHEETSE